MQNLTVGKTRVQQNHFYSLSAEMNLIHPGLILNDDC